ncbi:hypothetical protein Cgig2_008274 [Carnegiea gigantea]|uniref:DOG1 domain-containing protein n=1 Tax=Carnegiea gigantea TaxID=171969 RepID=A0A9Q1QV44_9CARY|nr:hypothetical protein Cgig2_008274 [Carnegiea gigantea]
MCNFLKVLFRWESGGVKESKEDWKSEYLSLRLFGSNMCSRDAPRPSSSSRASFLAFFEGWLGRQQAFLDELIHMEDDDGDNGSEHLAQEMLSHYGDYYEEKAKIMREDIFLVLCPPWLTSFERAFLWVAGFKPSLVFRLLEASISDMISEQVEQLKELKSTATREEREVEEEMATVQERVGSPELMDLARQVGQLVNGQVSDFNDAMKDLKQAMTNVVQRADHLRRFVVLRVVGILSRKQTIKFLIAAAKFQLWVRAWGLQKDGQGESGGSTTNSYQAN